MQKNNCYQKIMIMVSNGANLLAMKVLMNELKRIPKNRQGKKFIKKT